jgi:hypothetical protein
MRYFAIVWILLCSLVAASQTASTSKPKIVKSHALLACEAERDQLVRRLTENLDDLALLRSENGILAMQKAQLQEMYADAINTLSVLNNEIHGLPVTDAQKKQLGDMPAAHDTLDLAASIEREVQKLAEHDSVAVDKYNTLLTFAKKLVSDQQTEIELLSARSSYQAQQQQRFNNALAIYNLMPKYSPPQTIQLQVSDCTKFPALCTH